LVFSTAATIFLPSATLIARGFSQTIILPALAAAMAIWAWKLFGTQMSTMSMSSLSMTQRQSVQCDSKPHRSAKALASVSTRPQIRLSTGWYGTSKKFVTLQ